MLLASDSKAFVDLCMLSRNLDVSKVVPSLVRYHQAHYEAAMQRSPETVCAGGADEHVYEHEGVRLLSQITDLCVLASDALAYFHACASDSTVPSARG